MARDGDRIGVVVFESHATVTMGVTVVNSNTRNQIIRKIPTSANGGTNIPAGIITAHTYRKFHTFRTIPDIVLSLTENSGIILSPI